MVSEGKEEIKEEGKCGTETRKGEYRIENAKYNKEYEKTHTLEKFIY